MPGRQLGAYTIVNGVDTTPAFETALGAPLGLHMAFVDHDHGVSNLQHSIDVHQQVVGMAPSVWTVGICTSLEEAAKGVEDAAMKGVATRLAHDYPTGPIIIRHMHEAQGMYEDNKTHVWVPNYPAWFAPGREDLYKTVFRRDHDIFKSVSPRFQFDWCVNHTMFIGGAYYDPRRFYPGGDVADLIGGDAYPTADPKVSVAAAIDWLMKGAGYGFDMIAAIAKAEGKRMSLGEWGLARDGEAQVDCIADLVVSGDVAYHCYFNDAQFQLKNFPLAQAAYKRRFGQPVVTTAATFKAPAGQPFSVPLTANQKVSKWGFTATPAGSAQQHADSLAVTGPAGSKVDLVVRAVNEYGAVGGKKVSVSFG